MATATFKLLLKKPDGKTDVFPVPIGITTIGRQAGTDLILPHTQVSRLHARLEAVADECHITDSGSSNGSYVNGARLTPEVPVLLKHGDIIKIGPFELGFVMEAAPEAPAEAPAAPDPSVVEVVEPAPEPKKEAPPTAKAEKKEPAAEKKPAAQEPTAPAASGGAGQPPPPATLVEIVDEPPGDDGLIPPGLDIRSRKLLSYLPGIYHTDFMARFLGIFEATQVPLEWTIDNFDLFLDPDTSPQGFLPWLAGWFGVTFDASWSDEKRRALLKEAHAIYARRGTAWALRRVLEIYTGEAPRIDDTSKDLDDFTFEVSLAQRRQEVDENLVSALIEVHKPAHTSYRLKFRR